MELKRGLLFGVGVFLALAVVLAIMGTASASDTPLSSGADGKDHTITVTGTGDVYAQPDIVKVSIGVTTEGSTSTDAMQKNTGTMTKVVKAVKDTGIPDSDIQTSRVSVNPEYNYQSNTNPKITGYKATNTILVTLKDVSKAGPVVDAAYAAGANDINGPNYDFSDKVKADLYKQALTKAIADGADKANTMASAAGVSGLQLKSISESGSYVPPPRPMYASAMGAAAADSVPFSPGESKLSATVSMVYSFA